MELEWMNPYLANAEQMMYNNQVKEGLELMDSLLYEEPGYGALHNHLGWAYLYYTANTAKAELHLSMAIKFDEAYAPPYLHMGNLCIRMGRYTEALRYLETGLQKNNANKVAFLEQMAQVYELKKEYSKAIKVYKEALVSTVGFETTQLTEGIKRCQKKRWVMMFTF
jgi:tetratricopeptide (TPR) repeat protein